MADATKPVEYNVFNLDTVPNPKRTLSLKRTPVDVEIYRVDQKKPATTPAERAKEKQARKVKLATLMAKAEGGNPKEYYDAMKDIDDSEVQELLLDDRFARYMETPAIGASQDVQAKLDQTNRNARARAEAALESEKEFYEKQTGALTSSYEETANLITPETVIAGKIKAIGLSNEFNALLEKKARYGNSPKGIMEGAFTREELDLFSELDRQEFRLNLIGTPAAAGATHLDFGNKGGQDEDGPVEVDVFTEVNAAYDLKDRSTPAEQLLAVFKAASNANRGGNYDIIPVDVNFVDKIEDEYTISLTQAKVPEYADKVSSHLKGRNSAQQQAEVLGLNGDKYDIDQLYASLADQYLDQGALAGVDSKEQDAVRRAVTGHLQRILPAQFKGIRALNSAVIERNKRITDPELYENAIANYTAFPAPSDVIEAINSSDLREQVSKFMKKDRGASGIAIEGVVPDVMSSLLGEGTVKLTYGKFDKADEATQALIIKRAGISQLAGLMSKMHSNMEFAAGKRGIEEEVESLEETIANEGNLDQYQREELARILDVDYVPAGDLSPSYVDQNLDYADEYAELLDRERVAQEDEVAEVYVSEAADASTPPAYEPEDSIESFMRDDVVVDNSFATQATSVDMDAVMGAGVGSVNMNANAGHNLGTSAATSSATEDTRVDSPAARANRIATGLAAYKAMNPQIQLTDTEQGGSQWLKDRHFKATASDAKGFTGSERAQETFVRNKAKIATGITSQKFTSPDLQRGNDLEPLIRQQYEKETGYDIAEVSQMTSDNFPGAASLDGITMQGGKPTGRGVEIKAPREFTPQDTDKKKTFSNKYNDQVQMQMHIANLDQLDLVEGVVNPETNKLDLKTTTFDRSEKWAEENRDKIQRAQESLEANKGLTKDEVTAKIESGDAFLKGGAGKPEPGSYTQQGPSKEDLEEAVAAGNVKAAEVIAGDTSGRFEKKESTQPTSPAKSERKKKEAAASGVPGGGGGGDDEDAGPPASPDEQPEPAAGGAGGAGKRKRGKGGGGILATVTQAWDELDTATQGAHDLARGYLGDALDFGLDPSQMLADTRAQQATGMTEQAAVRNSQNLADLGAQRQLGDWSQSTAIITGSLGVIDDRMLEQYKDDPSGMIQAIRQTGKDRGMDDATIARITRIAGLQQAGGALSMSEGPAQFLAEQAAGADTLDRDLAGDTLAAAGTATLTQRRGTTINAINQGLQGVENISDDFAAKGVKATASDYVSAGIDSLKKGASYITGGDESDWSGLGTAAPADLGQYQAAPPQQNFQPQDIPQASAGGAAQSESVSVNVTLQTSGVAVVVQSGDQSTEVTKQYQSTSVQ